MVALLATHSVEPLANGRRNRCSQGFSGSLRELFRQSMSLRVLDIQSHCYTILPLSCNHSTIVRSWPSRIFGEWYVLAQSARAARRRSCGHWASTLPSAAKAAPEAGSLGYEKLRKIPSVPSAALRPAFTATGR